MKTKKKLLSGIIITAFLLIGAYMASALAPQTICPVMGNPLRSKNLYVDYKGKRVYFCCGPCPSRFMRYPEAYLKRLASIGQEPIPIPK